MNATDATFCEACAARFPKVVPPAETQTTEGVRLRRTLLSVWVVMVLVIAAVMFVRNC
jgi:hypothetical protein